MAQANLYIGVYYGLGQFIPLTGFKRVQVGAFSIFCDLRKRKYAFDASRIYNVDEHCNVDETRVSSVHKPGKVIIGPKNNGNAMPVLSKVPGQEIGF